LAGTGRFSLVVAGADQLRRVLQFIEVVHPGVSRSWGNIGEQQHCEHEHARR